MSRFYISCFSLYWAQHHIKHLKTALSFVEEPMQLLHYDTHWISETCLEYGNYSSAYNPQCTWETSINLTVQKLLPQKQWIKWSTISDGTKVMQNESRCSCDLCSFKNKKWWGNELHDEIQTHQNKKHIVWFSLELTSAPVQGNWAAHPSEPISELSICWQHSDRVTSLGMYTEEEETLFCCETSSNLTLHPNKHTFPYV